LRRKKCFEQLAGRALAIAEQGIIPAFFKPEAMAENERLFRLRQW